MKLDYWQIATFVMIGICLAFLIVIIDNNLKPDTDMAKIIQEKPLDKFSSLNVCDMNSGNCFLIQRGEK